VLFVALLSVEKFVIIKDKFSFYQNLTGFQNL